jgi:hypothetical protein
MLKGAIKLYATVLYALVFIAASAGAITHGFDNGEHFFTVMGVLNLICGGYAIYKVIKSEQPK